MQAIVKCANSLDCKAARSTAYKSFKFMNNKKYRNPLICSFLLNDPGPEWITHLFNVLFCNQCQQIVRQSDSLVFGPLTQKDET